MSNRVVLLICAAVAALPVRAAEEPNRWAVLIGVNDYVQFQDLKYCVGDVQALGERLVAAGFPREQVFIFHDDAEKPQFRPYKSSLEQQLDLVVQLVEENDVLLVAFSGHGLHLDGRSYLLPTDANLERAKETMVDVEALYAKLAQCPASLKLLVVDACRNDPRPSGQRSTAGLGNQKGLGETLERPPAGVVLLSSCSPGEISMEAEKLKHGVFMHYLLEGLEGAADSNTNRRVSVHELADYAGRKTRAYVFQEYSQLQRPFIKGDVAIEALAFDIGRAISPSSLSPITSPAAKPPAAKDPWLGVKVFWRMNTKLRVGSREVSWWDVPSPSTVTAVQGDWLWLGVAWLNKRDALTVDQALSYYSDQIRANPSDAANYGNRALVWQQKGELDNALRDYSESIRLRPTDIAYNNRGIIWRAKGELDNAIRDYTEAIRLNPGYTFAYSNRANAWKEKGVLDQALRDYTEAIRLNPRAVLARTNRVEVHIKRGDFEKALHDVKAALQLDPRSADAHGQLALLRACWPEAHYRDGEEAYREAKSACELTGWKQPWPITILASACAELGRFDEARKWQALALKFVLADPAYSEKDRKVYREELLLYEQDKPYRLNISGGE